MTIAAEAAIIIIILRRMWWDQQGLRALDVLQPLKKNKIPELSESARRRFVKKRLRPCKKRAELRARDYSGGLSKRCMLDKRGRNGRGHFSSENS